MPIPVFPRVCISLSLRCCYDSAGRWHLVHLSFECVPVAAQAFPIAPLVSSKQRDVDAVSALQHYFKYCVAVTGWIMQGRKCPPCSCICRIGLGCLWYCLRVCLVSHVGMAAGFCVAPQVRMWTLQVRLWQGEGRRLHML